MPVEVILPKVDMDMSHGTIAVWHVAEGAAVTKGAALFDIETDKAAMEVEAPASGRLHAVTAKPGDTVAVGSVVALILAEGEEAGATPPPPAPLSPAQVPCDDGAPPAHEVVLPKVDMDMSHGTIVRWHVREGQPVEKGAALFDIETDKAAMEVEAPASGVLHHVTAQEGDKVAVGTVVAFISPQGAAIGPAPAPRRAATPPAPPAAGPAPEPAPVALTPQAAPAPSAPSAGGGVRATPAARAAAKSAGIALHGVPGTGPNGRIQRDDVQNWQARAATPAAGATPTVWAAQSGALHVSHRRGTGRPIVLIHGFTADSQSWLPLEKALGPDRALIRIDLPSHGKSPRRRVKGFAELARMIVEAFDDATAHATTVDLVGHSLGGALAVALADVRPRKIASLSLIAPAGFGPEVDAAALSGILRASRSESLLPWLRRLTADPDTISEDYAKAAMRSRQDPALRAAQADLADVLFPDGVQAFDLHAAFSRLTAPTCVLWGREDNILPHKQALTLPGDAALHLLASAGHVPQYECPERVARIIARHMGPAL